MEDKRYLRKLQLALGRAVREGKEAVVVAGSGDKMYADLFSKKEDVTNIEYRDYDWYEIIELEDKQVVKRTKYVQQDGKWKTIHGVINRKEAK